MQHTEAQRQGDRRVRRRMVSDTTCSGIVFRKATKPTGSGACIAKRSGAAGRVFIGHSAAGS